MLSVLNVLITYNVTSLMFFLTVHHGTLRNQNQLDTLFLVRLLGVNASTCFQRYSSIFRRLCPDAIRCN
jgi:hypothetical protein